jgi:hypothetical protein
MFVSAILSLFQWSSGFFGPFTGVRQRTPLKPSYFAFLATTSRAEGLFDVFLVRIA